MGRTKPLAGGPGSKMGAAVREQASAACRGHFGASIRLFRGGARLNRERRSQGGVRRRGAEGLIFREIEDRDLIAKARRGSVDAYNVLVSRWEKRVFNYLLRLVRDREDALDLSQDVFLKAYQNLKKLEDPERFAAWLFRIAHNEAYSLLRRNRPEGELGAEPATAGISNRLYPVELNLTVETALARLTGEQREAVLLKVYQGFKFEEMAEILACPVSTIKSRVYTALDLLKETLAPVAARGASSAARPAGDSGSV
jgi:RNA polymerase sigma-70 factor (ECF subfamily)